MWLRNYSAFFLNTRYVLCYNICRHEQAEVTSPTSEFMAQILHSYSRGRTNHCQTKVLFTLSDKSLSDKGSVHIVGQIIVRQRFCSHCRTNHCQTKVLFTLSDQCELFSPVVPTTANLILSSELQYVISLSKHFRVTT